MARAIHPVGSRFRYAGNSREPKTLGCRPDMPQDLWPLLFSRKARVRWLPEQKLMPTGDDTYDVAVIGAGISGLTAGAFLARAGKRVAVIEARGRPGGHARSVDGHGYRFEPAVHVVIGGNRGGPLGPGAIVAALDMLGVSDLCEFLRVDPFYTAIFPGLRLAVPTGREAFVEAHVERFPSEESGFSALVELCAKIYRGMISIPVVPRLVDLLALPIRSPSLIRFRNATLEDATSRYLTEPELRALFAALAPYVGLPPSRTSFAIWASMIAPYIDEGAYYCRGGFQSLADALAVALANHGGELVLDTEVASIAVEDGRVRGVATAVGRRFPADVVVSTIDPRVTFGRLIPKSLVPEKWMDRILDTEVSFAVNALYLGTDLDLSQPRATFESVVYRTFDIEDAIKHHSDGRARAATVTIPTLADPGLAPPGCHQVNVLGMANPDPKQTDARSVTDSLLELAEQVVPGLRDHIVFALGANSGPPDPANLPLHRIDAAYGWALTPANSGPNRLAPVTPIEGLFLAGQWTQPAHGIETVVGSGIGAARRILGQDTHLGVRSLNR